MNKFGAQRYVNIASSLATLGGKWAAESDQATVDTVERFCFQISDRLEEIGCRNSAEAAKRFSMDFRIGMTPEVKESRANELKDTIYSEMEQHSFFWVPPNRARYYEHPDEPSKWNTDERAIEGPIRNRFLRASTEINRARECYALARWTPCVFHLMRACEVGIRALYKTLGIPLPRLSDSWGSLLKPMDEQLAKKPSDRHGDWATHPDFFDHATNDVRAIKRAWRDPTMHIESDYEEGEALKALGAVTSFFEHLASKLDADGNVFP